MSLANCLDLTRLAYENYVAIEHAAEGGAIYIACVDRQGDDPASVLIHHYHDPMRFQGNGLSAKEIYAPQAVFRMTQGSQPRRAMISRIRAVTRCKYTSNDILIQVQSACQIDLLGDKRAAISRVALFHFYETT